MPRRIVPVALTVALVFAFWAASLAAQRRPQFDVASVKKASSDPTLPSRRVLENGTFELTASLATLIDVAYGVPSERVLGKPAWASGGFSDRRFQVQGKAAGTTSAATLRLMLQTLLEDRFHLVVHRDNRPLRHYDMVLAEPGGEPGPFLLRVDECGQRGSPRNPPGLTNWANTCGSLDAAAGLLSTLTGEIILNKTALEGRFEAIVLRATDDPNDGLASPIPSVQRVLRATWGLTLQESQDPVEVLVIDAVTEPTAD